MRKQPRLLGASLFFPIILLTASPLLGQSGQSAAGTTVEPSITTSGGASELPVSAGAKARPKVRITYTGRLFGYFRWPGTQLLSPATFGADLPCPSLQDEKAFDHNQRDVANAETFLRSVDVEPGELASDPNFQSRVLVGTGDNFSPELSSRTLASGSDGLVPYPTKDQYAWDQDSKRWVQVKDLPRDENSPILKRFRAGLGTIPTDNVGCFLSRAGYDAIVPGKLDFAYGPERLRELARFLADLRQENYYPVAMLGANLILQTSLAGAASRIPDREKHLRFSNDSCGLKLKLEDGEELTNGSLILPWARRLRVDEANLSAAKCALGKYYLCNVSANPQGVPDPDNFTPPADDSGKQNGTCSPLATSQFADRSTGKPYKGVAIPNDIQQTLAPGTNYAICIGLIRTPLKGQPQYEPYCTRFSTATPFFLYPDHVPVPSATAFSNASGSSMPGPYLLKEVTNRADGTKVKVAIFGVVDEDLVEHIGELNASYVTLLGRRYLTQVKVVDPVSAARQLLDYFYEANPRFEGEKILLANMPLVKAQELAARLKGEFQVVVTQAEPELFTRIGTQTVTIEPQSSIGRASLGRDLSPPFLAIPEPFYNPDNDPAYRLTLRTQSVEVTCTPASGATCTSMSPTGTWTFTTTALSTPLRVAASSVMKEQRLAPAIDTALQRVDPRPVSYPNGKALDSPMAKLQVITLAEMRRYCHADMAFIQKIDVWEAMVDSGSITKDRLREALDRIYWKGDFVLCRSVQGSVVKRALAQSDRFNSDDESNLSLQWEKKRGLVTLGIFKDAVTKNYVVNGIPLDDNKIYQLATTDFISQGDTGYPDLRNLPVGNSPLAQDFAESKEDLHYLSELVCHTLNVGSLAGAACGTGLDAEMYFDALDLLPSDGTPGDTPTHHFFSWLSWRGRPSLYAKQNEAETAVQERPVQTLALEKMEFDFDLNEHNNGAESNIAKLFSGVPVPQVNAPTANTTTALFRLRWTRNARWVDEFILSEVNFSRTLTRQGDAFNTDLPSIPKNLLAFEGGFLPHLFPRRKELPGLRGLLSVRAETQLIPPLVSFRLNTTPSIPLRRPTERTESVLLKTGLRWQNQQSWIETGFETGWTLNNPVGYIFQPGGIVCPNGFPTIGSCVTANSGPGGPITLSSNFHPVPDRTRLRRGLFLNFSMSVPLPGLKNLTYVTENTGDVFFSDLENDTPTDTKWQDDWSHSLKIPLVGNLSLVPKVEFFFYENKILNHYFQSLHSTIGLQYTFEKHSGVGWHDALLYKNAAGK
jgi:hypothetical protein